MNEVYCLFFIGLLPYTTTVKATVQDEDVRSAGHAEKRWPRTRNGGTDEEKRAMAEKIKAIRMTGGHCDPDTALCGRSAVCKNMDL
jgi:hypothetical protein